MTSLSISTFDRLDAVELQRYVEPLIVNGDLNLSHDQFLHLRNRLRDYDQYHLVYALEICARHDSCSIAPLLPEFLHHVEGSVVCAAINILESLPSECISEELLQELKTTSVDSRWQELVKAMHGKLSDRARTNRCT
jgi:hypothetical protein